MSPFLTWVRLAVESFMQFPRDRRGERRRERFLMWLYLCFTFVPYATPSRASV